jgi:hypothetical protein
MKRLPDIDPMSLPVWREVAAGQESASMLLDLLKEKGIQIVLQQPSVVGVFLNRDFFCSEERRTYRVVRQTVRDLGFSRTPKATRVWKRIQELGFDCPDDLVLRICAEYSNQPEGELATFAMEPLPALGGAFFSSIFLERSKGVSQIGREDAENDLLLCPLDLVVFFVHKSSKKAVEAYEQELERFALGPIWGGESELFSDW